MIEVRRVIRAGCAEVNHDEGARCHRNPAREDEIPDAIRVELPAGEISCRSIGVIKLNRLEAGIGTGGVKKHFVYGYRRKNKMRHEQ